MHQLLNHRSLAAIAVLLALPHLGLARAPRARQAASRILEVTAKRYSYDPAQVDVQEGEHVTLLVKSADGVHGIEIKGLNIKREIPRGGDPIAITFTAGAPGRYPILCSEYCGRGHDGMRGMLVVSARSHQWED